MMKTVGNGRISFGIFTATHQFGLVSLPVNHCYSNFSFAKAISHRAKKSTFGASSRD
jgi:hypothetical protein